MNCDGLLIATCSDAYFSMCCDVFFNRMASVRLKCEGNKYDLPAVGTAAASMSLILIHQLEDKLKAHDLYLSFLKNVDLWSRVRCKGCRQ